MLTEFNRHLSGRKLEKGCDCIGYPGPIFTAGQCVREDRMLPKFCGHRVETVLSGKSHIPRTMYMPKDGEEFRYVNSYYWIGEAERSDCSLISKGVLKNAAFTTDHVRPLYRAVGCRRFNRRRAIV